MTLLLSVTLIVAIPYVNRGTAAYRTVHLFTAESGVKIRKKKGMHADTRISYVRLFVYDVWVYAPRE